MLAALVVLGGCAAFQQEAEPTDEFLFMRPAPAEQRVVFSKSYELGRRYTVAVDEPMVSIKNYGVAERVTRAVILQDFDQQCGSLLGRDHVSCTDSPFSGVRGNLGDTFRVGGAIVEEGVPYYMIEIEAVGGNAYMLADPDGYLRDGAYMAWRGEKENGMNRRGLPHEAVQPEIRLDVAGPLFSYETDETFVVDAARYLNYELVYKGTAYDHRGTSYRVLYREYRRDNTRVPSFEQVLSFAADQTDFELLGLRIGVYGATADTLTFSVEQDSVPPAPR